MPEVVQANERQASLAQDRLEPLCELVGVDWATRRSSKEEVSSFGDITFGALPSDLQTLQDF
jgi:hypothetical protein